MNTKNRLNILPENPEENSLEAAVGLGRFPSWLHRKLPTGSELWQTGKVLRKGLHNTVCEEAGCPNLMECWSKKTATFLMMGKTCTRACGFCDIDFSKNPIALEEDEPERLAQSVVELGLKHVVITMVARDDLPDGGASHLARTVHEIRKVSPTTTIELLTSDLQGSEKALNTVLEAKPEIFNHNIETVRALTPKVRHTASYERTLQVLKYVSGKKKEISLLVKSGLMVGLGETPQEVEDTLQDLYQAGCDIVTIGQYLQASRHKLRVKEFVTPPQFKKYEEFGLQLGIKFLYSGPFVRSSYNAADVFNNTLGTK